MEALRQYRFDGFVTDYEPGDHYIVDGQELGLVEEVRYDFCTANPVPQTVITLAPPGCAPRP